MSTSRRSTSGASARAAAARGSLVTWLPAHVSAAISAALLTAPAKPRPAAPQGEAAWSSWQQEACRAGAMPRQRLWTSAAPISGVDHQERLLGNAAPRGTLATYTQMEKKAAV